MADIDTSYGWGAAVASLTLASADIVLLASWTVDALQELLDSNQINSSIYAFITELQGVLQAVEAHYT